MEPFVVAKTAEHRRTPPKTAEDRLKMHAKSRWYEWSVSGARPNSSTTHSLMSWMSAFSWPIYKVCWWPAGMEEYLLQPYTTVCWYWPIHRYDHNWWPAGMDLYIFTALFHCLVVWTNASLRIDFLICWSGWIHFYDHIPWSAGMHPCIFTTLVWMRWMHLYDCVPLSAGIGHHYICWSCAMIFWYGLTRFQRRIPWSAGMGECILMTVFHGLLVWINTFCR